jgi:hypothetical protein
MICHPYRCVFVHIPKTAGKSIEHVFLSLLGLSWETRVPLLLRPNDDPRRGPPRLAHLKAREYVAYGHLTPQQFASYFKFSFVRNPWDRLVSEYKYRNYPKTIDFKTYLFKHFPAPGWSDAYCHVIPQHEFLFDDEGRLLVDFVGKYERLQADFMTICAQLNLPHQTVPHTHRSLERKPPKTLRQHMSQTYHSLWDKQRKHTFQHYTEYYDDESKEFVTHRYQKDITTFNYAFDDDAQATAHLSFDSMAQGQAVSGDP